MARERWKFDRATGKAILAESFGDPIRSKPMPKSGSTLTRRAFSVIRDVETYISPIDRSIIRSRSDHRDHMKRHGVVELGTEKLHAPEKAKRPRAGHDIKRAIEQVRSGRVSQKADFLPSETTMIKG